MSQLIGVAAVGVAVAAFSAVAFYALKRANLLRVSEDAERRGLDVEEYHPAYDLGQNEEGRERSGRDHIRAA
jgi:ammonia channel protein AmtB